MVLFPSLEARRRTVPRRSEYGRPNRLQSLYLVRGLARADRRLPLFDTLGQAFSPETVLTCLHQGWIEPWFMPKACPHLFVCRLTDRGAALAEEVLETWRREGARTDSF